MWIDGVVGVEVVGAFGLEEWERALGFFREAVRRDERHYNAWLVPSFLSSDV